METSFAMLEPIRGGTVMIGSCCIVTVGIVGPLAFLCGLAIAFVKCKMKL